MDKVIEAVRWFVSLPSPALMFFIFFVINLIFGMKFTRALKAALLYALGLFALSTFAFDVFLGTVGGAATAMIQRLGLSMSAVDYGVGVTPIIMAKPLVLLALPVGLLTNFVMLALRWTKTLDVDIWNVIYFMGATGVLVFVATNNIAFAVLSIIISMVITLKVADWSSKHISDVLPKFKGLSFPYVYSIFYTPLAYWFNKLFDLVPAIKNSKLSAADVRKKVGIFGEPAMIGFIVGLIMAILAGYDFQNIVLTGIKVGASLHFIPMTMSVLIEGLSETTTVIAEWAQDKFKDREFLIGMDGVLPAAEPEALAVGALMAPIAIIVSLILPGNTVLPVGMLSVTFILIGLSMPFFKMNILKGLLFSVVVIAIELWLGTIMAPYFTQLAIEGGVAIPYGATQITNACCATNVLNVKVFELIGNLFRP
ncbi:MAG: hypothetical protein PHW11_06395 [Anaerolineaceae bacterium]|jgi:PTS system galactitol-specific IIC component|nr:hypothetical protein [Anaerolineaceae bacterium]MDD4042462.1 hypothetical protein [Anaerolineaceae bacterium]MDD4577169.1 hypothetical protein [Anaerolineaceae bacterium]